MNKRDFVRPAHIFCAFEMSIILPLSLSTYRSNSFNNNTKYFFFDTVLSALKVTLSCLILKKKTLWGKYCCYHISN